MIVAGGLLVGWLAGSFDAKVAEIGRPAPDFTVRLIRGGSFSLSKQLATDDRPIVLNLWASWCVPCRKEMPEISAFAEAHPDVVVLGVAVMDVEAEAAEFAEELSPSYDLAFGDVAFEAAYPPPIGLPTTFVIGADGVVEAVFNGVLTEETLTELVFSQR